MNKYIVEHKANVPDTKEQPVLWTSPLIIAPTALKALSLFHSSKFGFVPYSEHEFLHVRRTA